MTLKDALTQFIATNDLAVQQLELAERILNAPPPVRRHHEMQTFNFGKRTSLMELRPRQHRLALGPTQWAEQPIIGVPF